MKKKEILIVVLILIICGLYLIYDNFIKKDSTYAKVVDLNTDEELLRFDISEDAVYEEEVKRMVRGLNLENYIHFAGRSDRISQLYREATYFCLPSLYEGFANVLCEAMASGLVCVASNVCDNPRILNRSERLFDPNNPIDMADKIEAMLAMPLEEYQIESIGNRERILELCSPKVFLNSYLKLCVENH